MSTYLRLPKGVAPSKAGAVRLLGECGTQAVPILVRALGSSDPEVRTCAAETLGSFGADAAGAVEALARAAEDAELAVRREAIWALGRIGTDADEAANTIRRALQEEDTELRLDAAVALWRVTYKSKESVAALQDAWKESADAASRWRVAWALADVGWAADEAVPLLARALDGDDAEFRRAAITALCEIGDVPREGPFFGGAPVIMGGGGYSKEGILTEACRHKDPYVRLAAEAALLRRKHRPGRRKWKREIEQNLDRKVTFQFVNTPLDECMGFFGSMSEIETVIDPSLSYDSRRVPVTLKVKRCRLKWAFGRVLAIASVGAKEVLDYKVTKDGIFISAPRNLYRDRPLTWPSSPREWKAP